MWGFGGRYYWGKKVASEKADGIVVVFAWMSSEEKHLMKYVDLYSSVGWNSLVCHSQFLNMFFPEKATILAVDILNELVEVSFTVDLYFVGGAKTCMYKILQIISGSSEAHNMGDYQLVRECISGYIYDSSPVDFTSDLGVRFLLHPTVLKVSHPPRFASWVANGIASGLDSLFLSRFESQRAEYWRTLYSTVNMQVPYLILCSENDDLAPFQVISNFFQRLKDLGGDVKLLKWSASPHISGRKDNGRMENSNHKDGTIDQGSDLNLQGLEEYCMTVNIKWNCQVFAQNRDPAFSLMSTGRKNEIDQVEEENKELFPTQTWGQSLGPVIFVNASSKVNMMTTHYENTCDPFDVNHAFCIKQFGTRDENIELEFVTGHFRHHPIDYKAATIEILGKAVATYRCKNSRQVEDEKLGIEGTKDEITYPFSELKKEAMTSTSFQGFALAPSDSLSSSSAEYYVGKDIGTIADERKGGFIHLPSRPSMNAHGVLSQILFDVCVPKNVEDWDVRSNSKNALSACTRKHIPFNPIKCMRRSRL
ncbi:unnamed protein product [Sphenostylis stenocarpa]|uniref:Uncharacterized protein n=1 Tax=Sphenostylis stenocarpa TaxID=92480 RepID=A0AA86W0F5_9FABA|nr:unnamed protein product [Sphenostylis stenocarpa]